MSDTLPTNFTLNNGVKFPTVGMGCWMGEPGGGQRVYDMCANALKAGYRHFDTADGYKNEEEVGRAIKDSGIPREEIFITTKLSNGSHHRVQEAFEKSLANLNSEYIDLYLVHWPQAIVDGAVLQPEDTPTIVDTWKDMEKLLSTGKVKAIGVSNFGVPLLKQLIAGTSVVPATNQVELHPCLPVEELREYCKNQGIIITAYSPIGQPKPGKLPTFLEDEPVKGIAARLNVSPAQVVLSWAVQNGIVVVPKSENLERMKSNLKLVKLSDEDIKAVDGIHRQPGQHRSLLGYHGENGVFGWTYEQLGWNMTKGGIVPS